jgi:hypothetical protein
MADEIVAEVAPVVEVPAAEVPATETPAVEAAPVVPVPPKPEPKSDRFAAAAKKEGEIRRAQRAMQQREAALVQREAALKKFEESKSVARTNPDEFLQNAGLSYDELVQAKLGKDLPLGPEETAAKVVDERLNLYKEQVEQEKARATWEQFEADAIAEVQQATEQYELINANGAAAQVPMLVAQYFQQTGEIVSTKQVADYLEGLLEQQAEKVLQSKKMKAKLAATPAPTPKQPVTKTLSTSLTPAPGSKPSNRYDPEEATNRALAALTRELDSEPNE